MRKTAIILAILSSLIGYAQNTFVKSIAWYDDAHAIGIERVATGGYVVAGSKSDSNPYDNDAFIAKIDANGDTLWTRYFGNTTGEVIYDLTSTADGGFAVTGSGTFNSQSGGTVMLVKFDSTGVIQWSRAYGGLNSSLGDEGWKVVQTNDGGFFIAGITFEFGPYPGVEDIYLLRIDSQGNLLWTRAYGTQYHDEPTGLDKTSDGGFIISGRTDVSVSSTIHTDAFLMRVDSLGNNVWTKRYGGTGYEWGKCVHTLPNGDFMLTGDETSYHSTQGYGVLIMRINPSGNVIWAKSYSQQNKNVVVFGSTLTANNGIILTGYYESWAGDRNVLNLRVDSVGTMVWQKHLGGTRDELCYDIAVASDSGFVFVGGSVGFTSFTPSQAILLKSDLTGDHGCYDSLCNLTVTNANVNPVTMNLQQYTGGTGDTIIYPVWGGMGKYVYCTNNVGIETSISGGLAVYPNPTADIINVTVEIGNLGQYILYDVNGKMVMSTAFNGAFLIDLSQCGSGIYYLRCETADATWTKRIIKTNIE